jgi:hypothetical protein
MNTDVVPEYRQPQRDETYSVWKKLMIDLRRYMESGLVSDFNSFFAVMKGDDDIRLVFNGTISGLNAALCAPWFCLPSATTHMRIVEKCF